MSPVVHQTGKKGSLRERLFTKSIEYSKRYADTELHCDSNIRATFFTLRDLVVFFDAYHEQKFDVALETLNKLNLVPLNVNDLEKCVNNFKRYAHCKKISLNSIFENFQFIFSVDLAVK